MTTPATPSCPGVATGTWGGADVDPEVYQSSSGILPGVDLVGTGSLSSRLWAKPSATVIGIDAPSVAEAANILIPEATAKVSMRIVPGSDAEHELELLVAHLRSVAPWNVQVEVTPLKAGWPFAVDMDGAAVKAAEAGLQRAFGSEVESLGSGGSIPLINSLKNACPRADVILWGAEDTKLSRIHASNESVDPAEIERMVVAQVLTLRQLGSG